MTINFLATWEQEKTKTGNTGTKVYSRKQRTLKSKKYFYETREHKKNLLGTRDNTDPFPPLGGAQKVFCGEII